MVAGTLCKNMYIGSKRLTYTCDKIILKTIETQDLQKPKKICASNYVYIHLMFKSLVTFTWYDLVSHMGNVSHMMWWSHDLIIFQTWATSRTGSDSCYRWTTLRHLTSGGNQNSSECRGTRRDYSGARPCPTVGNHPGGAPGASPRHTHTKHCRSHRYGKLQHNDLPNS